MKSFSTWLIEREVEENKMTADVVKKINIDLFNFVKTTKPFEDLKEVIPQIEDILEKYQIVLLGEGNEKFADKIIISLNEKSFNLGKEVSEESESYEAYTNVELVLHWSESDRQFIIKDAAIEGK